MNTHINQKCEIAFHIWIIQYFLISFSRYSQFNL